jgi:hypothetical protein
LNLAEKQALCKSRQEGQRVCIGCRQSFPVQRYSPEVRRGQKFICAACAETLGQGNPSVKQIIKEYLFTHPCVDCWEDDPVVLEFDHRDPTAKKGLVGQMSRSTVRAEIEKCDVRCANCHRRRHHRERQLARLQKANQCSM